jgi:hypothetical protein
MEAFQISQELGSNALETGMEEELLAVHPILVPAPKPNVHLALELSQWV